MSLVSEQSIFLLQVGELIRKAHELGFVVTGGELYRTPEQQALYMKNGRSKTMGSQHLKRLAVDLNFFKEDADGGLALTYDADALRPLGQYWESLDSANRWGGNWSSFKDTPHFERRPASAVEAPSVSTAGAVEAVAEVAGVAGRAVGGSASRGGAGLLAAAVGVRCPNQRDDVETVQRILNLSLEAGKIALDAPLSTDGAFGGKTLAAISAFQRAALGETEPDGVVSVKGATWSALCDFLPTVDQEAFMALLYLRAAEADASGFHASLLATMKQRGIDSPLRIAHFLAQLGHESGELRFHEEIASGKAYEGRADLGNTRSGDGPRFKGRGLIQLTGRANYESYGKAIGRKDEILAQPTLIATDPALCVDVAGWYWETRKINPLADRDDLIAVTKKINGGTNGLEDRRRLLVRAKGLLGIG